MTIGVTRKILIGTRKGLTLVNFYSRFFYRTNKLGNTQTINKSSLGIRIFVQKAISNY